MQDRKDKIKTLVTKLKEETQKRKLGKPEITGVKDPKRAKASKKKESDKKVKDKKPAKAASSLGPRGGSFHTDASGRKIYDKKSSIKKSLVDYIKEIEFIDSFIAKFKELKEKM